MYSLGSLGGEVRFAFTSRTGGVSAAPYDGLNLSVDVGDDPDAVASNRRSVLEHLRVERAVWLRARHGADVRVVDAPEPALAADAAVTSARGLAVASLSADCVLLVLADPAEGVIATAHCGRQGLVAGIVPAVLASMRVEGARTIRAAVGPAVCGTCYEVPAELADEVAAVVPIARSVGVTGAPALDIRAGVLSQLRDGGAEIVRLVGGCTREDPSAFSYRRDKVTGRMAALVWRPA